MIQVTGVTLTLSTCSARVSARSADGTSLGACFFSCKGSSWARRAHEATKAPNAASDTLQGSSSGPMHIGAA